MWWDILNTEKFPWEFNCVQLWIFVDSFGITVCTSLGRAIWIDLLLLIGDTKVWSRVSKQARYFQNVNKVGSILTSNFTIDISPYYFRTNCIETLCHRNNTIRWNKTMWRSKPKYSTVRCRDSYTSPSVSTCDRLQFFLSAKQEDPEGKLKIPKYLENQPKEKSTSFALTATADPLEDPPGTRSGEHGFLGVP